MAERSKAKRCLFCEQSLKLQKIFFFFVIARVIQYKYNFKNFLTVRTRWPRGQRRWHVSNHGIVAPQCSVAWDLVVRLWHPQM